MATAVSVILGSSSVCEASMAIDSPPDSKRNLNSDVVSSLLCMCVLVLTKNSI